MTLPFSILPLVLAGCFALVWAFIARLEYEEQLDAARHEGEVPGGVAYFGGGSVGITDNAPERPAVIVTAQRPTRRVSAGSTPVILQASYGTSSRTVPPRKREGHSVIATGIARDVSCR